MTNTQAILIGAIFIASAIVMTNAGSPARASNGGPYYLMQHSNPTANAGVFRVDSSSGEVSYCFVSSNNQLACSSPVK